MRYILAKYNKNDNRIIIDTTKEKDGSDFGTLSNGVFLYHYECCDILRMSDCIFDLIEEEDLIILDDGTYHTAYNIKGKMCINDIKNCEVKRLKDNITKIYKKDCNDNFIKFWEREE